MKSMSRMAKFLVICAVVFGIGTAMTIVGFATGGISGLDKVSDKHEWIQASPGDAKQNIYGFDNCDSINIEGVMDVHIAGPAYWADMQSDMADEGASVTPKAGEAYVIQSENADPVKFSEADGTLSIVRESAPKVTVNLTNDDFVADAYIFCSQDALKNIKVTSEYADVEINGVTFSNADIKLESGDVDMTGVTSSGINIKGSDADVELAGKFNGKNNINVLNGDVEIYTSLAKGECTVDLETINGEIEIDDVEQPNQKHYVLNGNGQNTFKINVQSGDIGMGFDTVANHILDDHDDDDNDNDYDGDHDDHDND